MFIVRTVFGIMCVICLVFFVCVYICNIALCFIVFVLYFIFVLYVYMDNKNMKEKEKLNLHVSFQVEIKTFIKLVEFHFSYKFHLINNIQLKMAVL